MQWSTNRNQFLLITLNFTFYKTFINFVIDQSSIFGMSSVIAKLANSTQEIQVKFLVKMYISFFK